MQRTSRILAFVVLAATSVGCKKPGGNAGVTSSGNASIAADSMKVDKVSNTDGPITPDGNNDGAIKLVVDGPIAGIALASCEKDGTPSGGQQWDTYVGDQKLPASAKLPYEEGGPTWQLAVVENGKLLNDAKGALVPLGAGPHTLTLYAGDSGSFTKESNLIVFVERPDHSVVRSNVFTF